MVDDTGGLDIKPGNSMTAMKKDMAGAAQVGRMWLEKGYPLRFSKTGVLPELTYLSVLFLRINQLGAGSSQDDYECQTPREAPCAYPSRGELC